MKLNIAFILLFLLSTCGKKEKYYEATFLECGTEQDKVYDITYEYFSKDDSILINTRVINLGQELSKKQILQRVDLLNNFFSDTKIRFVVNGIDSLSSNPLDNNKAVEAISVLESVYKRPQESLITSYHIKDYRNWSAILKSNNFINIFIFPDTDKYPPGLAEGIPSNSIGIQHRFFINPLYYTLEHELAHAVGGLYHTHEQDHTDGLNNIYGDKVRDTYKSVPDLFEFVDNGCNFKPITGIPLEHSYTLVHNVMSYTLYQCRNGFTPVQIMRILNTIEISETVRNTLIRKENKKVESWDILKERFQ
jgi:hypothetical protein